MIKDIFHENKSKLDSYRAKWGYYMSEDEFVPISTRPCISPLKQGTETRIHADFMTDIIDLKVGYLFSKICMNSSDTNIQEILNTIDLNNHISSMNIESGRYSAACGLSWRLAFNSKGILKYKNIPAWQIIPLYDDDIYFPNAILYTHFSEGNQCIDVYKLPEVGSQFSTVTYYIWDPEAGYKKSGDFVPNNVAQDGSNVDVTGFASIPFVPFLNNGLFKGNCDNTMDMMNAYDNLESDVVSEVRAQRLSYMKIWGQLNTNVEGPDGKPYAIPLTEWLTQTGTLNFGMDDEGNKYGDAQFLEKQLNDSVIEHQLDRLRQQIYEQSHSIDIRELTEAASARVFTVKAALMRFEIDASTTESFLRRSLIRCLSLASEYEQANGRAIFNPQDVSIYIGRSFPVDIDTSASALQKLLQVLPVEKAYSLSDLVESNEVTSLAAKFQNEQDTSMLNVNLDEGTK